MKCGMYRGVRPTPWRCAGPGWVAYHRPRVVIVQVPARTDPVDPMPAFSFRRFHLMDGSVSQ